jgi:hypothetical protein
LRLAARRGTRFHPSVRALAVVLALIAAASMVVAIKGMVTGSPGDRAGYLVRVLALVCFGGAVALTVASH